MRIFVASWFFPPNTSSEGIVTYKLLKNSVHDYDVVTVTSHKWGYKNTFPINDSNIHVTLLDTDSVDEWVKSCIVLFEKNHSLSPYDAYMTRCMPREALKVGIALKKKFPDIPWICSLADPVGNDPYVRLEIQQSEFFSRREKNKALAELSLPASKWTRKWENHASNNIADQFRYKRMQDIALQTADLLIAPCIEQATFMANGVAGAGKIHIIPHSFDDTLFQMAPDVTPFDSSKNHFSFFGYSNPKRSVRPFIDAFRWIQQRYPSVLDQMQLHIYGNYEIALEIAVEKYGLAETVCFHGSVDYLDSLALMRQSDCLLHVDTYFPEFEITGGSIFLAGKLADYIGAAKPILGVTGHGSPAWNAISLIGGETFCNDDICAIAHAIIMIALGENSFRQNEYFIEMYNAKKVARDFDALLDKRSSQKWLMEIITNCAAEEEIPKRKSIMKAVFQSLIRSPLFMNDYLMSFLKKQKENRGMCFRVYEWLKRI